MTSGRGMPLNHWRRFFIIASAAHVLEVLPTRSLRVVKTESEMRLLQRHFRKLFQVIVFDFGSQ